MSTADSKNIMNVTTAPKIEAPDKDRIASTKALFSAKASLVDPAPEISQKASNHEISFEETSAGTKFRVPTTVERLASSSCSKIHFAKQPRRIEQPEERSKMARDDTDITDNMDEGDEKEDPADSDYDPIEEEEKPMRRSTRIRMLEPPAQERPTRSSTKYMLRNNEESRPNTSGIDMQAVLEPAEMLVSSVSTVVMQHLIYLSQGILKELENDTRFDLFCLPVSEVSLQDCERRHIIKVSDTARCTRLS